jgi:hypothetical protein
MDKTRQNGKPICWEGVDIGDRLNVAKKFLKGLKSDIPLPTFADFGIETNNPSVEEVEVFLQNNSSIMATDGRQVNLQNPEKGSLKQRAMHLMTRGRKHGKGREKDESRIPYIPAIPGTLQDADLVAEGQHYGQKRTYYFKNYKNCHLVILEQDGLITQYPTDLKQEFDASFRVVRKKGRSS